MHPIQHWLQPLWQRLIKAACSLQLDTAVMLAEPEQCRGRFGSKLWQVTLPELWLQLHNIG